MLGDCEHCHLAAHELTMLSNADMEMMMSWAF